MLGTRASLGRTVRASHRGYVVITAGGCSAVAATQPIINAEAHEVACAVGVVVLCGTLAMFIYPALHAAVPALAASARLTGIYTGATNPNPSPSPSSRP